METNRIPAHPTSQHVAVLLPKLQDPDADFRYMSLNDLYATLQNGHAGFLLGDYSTCSRTVEGILKTLDDQNGEVQNLAIKCLSPLVLKLPPDVLSPLLEKLSSLSLRNSVDTSISATALRTVVATFPRPVTGLPPSKATVEAYSAISKVLIPRLVGREVIPHGKARPISAGMLSIKQDKSVDSDAIDVLIEIVRSFGIMLQVPEIQALVDCLMSILEDDAINTVVQKKATTALSLLAAHFTDGQLSSFVSKLIERLRDSHLTTGKRRILISLIGSLGRSVPHKFGRYLKTLAPFVLSPLSEEELDDEAEVDEISSDVIDVREAALSALETLLLSCGESMRPFITESIDAAIRFLRYDPNIAEDDDEDMGGLEDDDDMEDLEDEDFEEETGFDDDDDTSWKVRRCSAKVLYAIIAAGGVGDLLEDGTLYDRVAPILVERFKEREENVRLEILGAMSLLVRNSGQGLAILNSAVVDDNLSVLMGPPQGRKRRRGGSDASMFDTQSSISLSTGLTSAASAPIPASGPRASLAQLTPAVVGGIARLLKDKSIPTKQSAIMLLKDVVIVERGGLSDHMKQIIPSVTEAVKAAAGHSGGLSSISTGGAASATASSLRIEALSLLSLILELHQPDILQPFLDDIVPSALSAVQDKYYKVSAEALCTVEQLIRLITPPRWNTAEKQQHAYIENIYSVVSERVSSNEADAEVRQRAIHALGVLVARTSGSDGAKLFSSSKRTEALEILYDRLKNEVTRLAAVRAVDTVAALASDSKEFTPAWVRNVALELGAQLRKSNRSLRGASLASLKNLVVNPAGRANLDDTTIKELADLLHPLLSQTDLHMLGPALVILADLVKGNPKLVVTDQVTKALCEIVKAPLTGATLDALLILVKTIGEQGVGKPLMTSLLKDVALTGDPVVLGKVIGTLLVSGGPSVGVKLDAFVSELSVAGDEQRRCLALSVLGEAGMRMGASFPLDPATFMAHFASKSEPVPLTAAIALGRAGVANVPKYLPAILKQMTEAKKEQYLLLHSIKEILQHATDAHANITPYARQIWDITLSTSDVEDNRAVASELLGRLAIVDPRTYLPALESYLEDPMPTVRGMVIQAIRYTFVDTDESYDDILRPIIIEMLKTMLSDSELENRRLALTTLNSAAHNKADLIAPYLPELLPAVISDSTINPDLVREVQMGPFKHKVDDGLELRKSGYETLYALMETSFPRISVVQLYDRIIAGLEDDHDIFALCNLMLTKLIVLNADETQRRLGTISEKYRAVLSVKLKESAVKQEVEKASENSQTVLRVSVLLNNAFPGAASNTTGPMADATWKNYWDWASKEFAKQLKAIQDKLRE